MQPGQPPQGHAQQPQQPMQPQQPYPPTQQYPAGTYPPPGYGQPGYAPAGYAAHDPNQVYAQPYGQPGYPAPGQPYPAPAQGAHARDPKRGPTTAGQDVLAAVHGALMPLSAGMLVLFLSALFDSLVGGMILGLIISGITFAVWTGNRKAVFPKDLRPRSVVVLGVLTILTGLFFLAAV